jgi:hypothetical protein
MNIKANFIIAIFSLVMMWTMSSCSQNDCQEIVISDCVCDDRYDPVCGCNNKTYGNACAATCSGITDFVPGKCN